MEETSSWIELNLLIRAHKDEILHLMLQLRELAKALMTGWLVGWLAERQIKIPCAASRLEMPKLPWFNAEQRIQRLRETGLLEWIVI